MEIADLDEEQREGAHEEEDDKVVERPSGSPGHFALLHPYASLASRARRAGGAA
jgi:hypothetical protein